MKDGVPMSEVASVRSGYAFKSDQWSVSGIPVVKIANVKDGTIDLTSTSFVSPTVAAQASEFRLRRGDIVMAMTGYVGEVARVSTDDELLLNQRVGRFEIVDQSRLDSEFLFQFLRTPEARAEITSRAYGSAQPNISPRQILSLRIPLPAIAEQRAIAGVLGSLDEKIAINRRLAEAADALVRARWEASCLAAVELTRIGALFDEVGDRVQPDSVDPETPYVGLEHVPRRLMWLNDYGNALSVSSLKATFRPGDTLFGKLRPYFHKVVVAAIFGVCSTDIIVARPKDDHLAGFALAAIASDDVVAKCTATSHGTRMPRTNWQQLSAVEIPWPGQEYARNFSSVVVALQDTVAAHLAEVRTLSQLRDSLIPELMFGRLRVEDAESQVEAVV